VKAINFRLKIEHLWGFVALVGIFVFINTHPIRPQDFWWHIAIGREIVTTGKIPTADIYSYTEAGQPYPSYQMFWLMETVLFELYHLGGPALVIFVYSLMITAAYGIIFWICKQSTQGWRVAAFSVLFAAALGLNDWNVRPQGITFLLGSLFLLAIYQYRRNNRWYWLVIFPLGMSIWVNSHGTFMIGLVMVGLWWGQELWEAVIQRIRGNQTIALRAIIVPGILFVITTLVCLVNPRGIGIIDYVKTLTSNSVVQNLVVEWAPPTLNTYLGVIFFCALFGIAVLLAVSPKRPNFYQLAALVVFGLLGIKTSRGIVWFGLVMAPTLADHLSAIVRQYQPTQPVQAKNKGGSRLINTILVALILLMGIASLPWFKSFLPLPAAKAGLISSETPIQATQFLLEQNPPGKLFNSMSFGSYLIWAAYPQYQVFVDTRIELFSGKVWMDYLNISNASGDWETGLRNYGVNTLMISPEEQAGLVQAVLTSNEWTKIYQDDVSDIFIRVSEH
jgi:hypothetical protein